MYRDRKIIKFGISGGPSGGKSAFIEHFSQHYRNLGYIVLNCHESATMLGDSGLPPAIYGGSSFYQSIALKTTMHFEDLMCNVAKDLDTDKPVLIITDRPLVNGIAYRGKKYMCDLFEKMGSNIVEMRDASYDAILHFVTPANGAEAFYSHENNPNRHETPEQAREQDEKLIQACLGAPHLRVIDNRTDFAGKLARGIAECDRVIGVPSPLEIERKYLVKGGFSLTQLPVAHETVDITQFYLDDGISRIRVRSQDGYHLYTHTIKKQITTLVREEHESQIAHDEFVNMQHRIMPRTMPIVKKRTCFFHEGQYFELDYIPSVDLWLLELELLNESDQVILPPYISGLEDVTNHEEFSNFNLAKVK